MLLIFLLVVFRSLDVASWSRFTFILEFTFCYEIIFGNQLFLHFPERILLTFPLPLCWFQFNFCLFYMILVFMAVDKVEHLLKLAFMYCLGTLKISYLVIAACIADENHNIRVTCIDKKLIRDLEKGIGLQCRPHFSRSEHWRVFLLRCQLFDFLMKFCNL